MPSDDERQTYVQDPRTICKYGAKCYQKNPEHHKTYKHPPQNMKGKQNTRDKRRFSPYTRKATEQTRVKKKEDTDNDDNVLATDVQVMVSVSSNINNTDLRRAEDTPVKPDNLEYYEKNTNRNIFKELFLVDMPDDFYKFYECLHDDRTSIEKLLASVNLELIGPYDVLLGKLPILDVKELYLVHWRFFYDPPEFQAVLKKKGNSQFHIGYYRDGPDEKPAFLASNDSDKDCRLTPMADNIFAAVYLFLQNEKKKSPFFAMACQKVMDKVKNAAEKHDFSLQEYSMKTRQAQIVAKTLHGAGISVPYNKKTLLGYRNLTETDANLKKIFSQLENAANQTEKDKALSELQPVITYANIAVDECDFGTGLEAGIDLFCSGIKELELSALGCLKSVYNLLKREAFIKIIMVHLRHRRKGSKLSVLDFK